MSIFNSIIRAVYRSRIPSVTIALVYLVSVIIGLLMVHARNVYALNYRDQIVGQAQQQDQSAIAANKGNHLKAGLLDFSENLILGAFPKTISGFGVVFPYPYVAYQGWIGGIVSVRSDYSSRLNDPRSAFYYILTLILQLIPYSLACGAGINVGISLFKPATYYQGEKWLGIFPKEAIIDVGRIYLLVIPLFLIASLWEFLSPWNI